MLNGDTVTINSYQFNEINSFSIQIIFRGLINITGEVVKLYGSATDKTYSRSGSDMTHAAGLFDSQTDASLMWLLSVSFVRQSMTFNAGHLIDVHLANENGFVTIGS